MISSLLSVFFTDIWAFFWTGLTGFFGFSILVALRMRATKPQSPAANQIGDYNLTIKGVGFIHGESRNAKQLILLTILFRRRRIEFSHFHPGSEKE